MDNPEAFFENLYRATLKFRYEADIFYACRPSCAHWSWVLYRVDPGFPDGDVRTPVDTGRFCMTREVAIEKASEAAASDREDNWRGWAAAGSPQLTCSNPPETVQLKPNARQADAIMSLDSVVDALTFLLTGKPTGHE